MRLRLNLLRHAACLTLLLFTTGLLPMAGAQGGYSQWLSSDINGLDSVADLRHPTISGDGSCIAFSTHAALIPLDTDTAYDVYVRDLNTGVLSIVSVKDTGEQTAGSCGTWAVGLSEDARYVVFSSGANLVSGMSNNLQDTFVYDRQTGGLEQMPISDTRFSDISADGRYVTYDLGGAGSKVYHYDRQTGTNVRVSMTGTIFQCSTHVPFISGDGRWVLFFSCDPQLLPGFSFPAGQWQVFVRDVINGITHHVSTDSAGVPGNDHSNESTVGIYPATAGISDDGRHVVFSSKATNLVPNDTNGRWDVFMKDVQTGITTRVNLGIGGAQANIGATSPTISGDGRYVAFRSSATSLTLPPGPGGAPQMYVRDLVTGQTVLASIDPAGHPANQDSKDPCLSTDGRSLAFRSLATNLGGQSLALEWDAYLHTLFPRISAGGLPQVGSPISLTLESPDDAGLPYVAAASLAYRPGIPLDWRRIPLDLDPLFDLSVNTPALFSGFVGGTLDGSGMATATINVPADPSLVGFSFYTAFVTLDPTAPLGVNRISNALPLTLN